MKLRWDEDMLNRCLHLHGNEDLGWLEIQQIMGFETPDVARLKCKRELALGHPLPRAGLYVDWKWGETLQQARDAIRQESGVDQIHVAAGAMSADLGFEVEGHESEDYFVVDGKYVFSVNDQVLKITKEKWEGILADYAASGANLSQQEIAMKYGLPRKTLEACLKRYGGFKARPPVSREALRDGPMEPLIQHAIEVREHRFAQRLEIEQQAQYRLRVESLERELNNRGLICDEARTIVADALANLQAAVPYVELQAVLDPTAVYHIPVFDAHLGQHVDGEMGWGPDYDLAAAKRAVTEHGRRAAAYILRKTGGADKVFYTLGGDFFHAMLGQTKKGTKLDHTENDRLVFRAGLEAVVDSIQALRAVAKDVIVLSIPGNHDHLFADILEETLHAWYRNTPGVFVPNERGKRKVFRVGTSLHVLDHGEGFETFGPRAMLSAEMIARVVGGSLFEGVKKVYMYCGHTHHPESKAHGPHLELIRVASMAPASEYAEGLVLYNEMESPVFALDSRGRIEDIHRIYLADLLAA